KFVSPCDPAAQWTGAMRGPAFFAYADNYLIDVKFGVIMDVEASRAIRQAEVGAAKTMIDRTEERFGLRPERLAADTAYGSAPMLDWLIMIRLPWVLGKPASNNFSRERPAVWPRAQARCRKLEVSASSPRSGSDAIGLRGNDKGV